MLILFIKKMKLNKISFQLIAKERLKIFEHFLALTIKKFLPVKMYFLIGVYPKQFISIGKTPFSLRKGLK